MDQTNETVGQAAAPTLQLLQDDPLQTQAIALCCDIKNRIAGVTGQAGTGKTTIMRRVHEEFSQAGYNVVLTAPTGKAAKRISEATGIPAVTIHRLLEFSHPGDPDPETGKVTGVSAPKRTYKNPLEQSVILVDEASMINKQLWRDLVDAMRSGSVLRVFGDVNQLPPIEEKGGDGSPSPFMDALNKFPSVKLEHIYRQGEGSSIVKNGHRILNSMMPFPSDDFKIIYTMPTPTMNPVDQLLRLVTESKIDFASLNNQIITPINKSWIGQVELNEKLQQLIMGDKMYEAQVMPRKKWAKDTLLLVKGDKVIWSVNDYKLEIFNGETGIVVDIVNDVINIDFGDRTIGVPPWVEYLDVDGNTTGYDPRVQLDLAYAVTTHKSQGSEYENIVYVIDKSAYSMLYRNNFYTAVTRARKRAYIISDQRSLQNAVINKTAPIDAFIKRNAESKAKGVRT